MQNTNEEEENTVTEGSEELVTIVDGEEVPNYDATINIFQEGDIVSGEVVRIDKDEILVDIKYKSEGVIPASELSIRKSVSTEDEVSIGDMIDALVMQKEDAEGRLILSKKRARFEQAWKRIEAVEREGGIIDGTVIEVVKGGLILDLGVRGFLPASLVDIRRIQNLDEYMGQVLTCKVIELNRNRNNVVLSRRAVLEEERKEVREQILDKLQPGDVVTGVISNIVDFGAFVDLEGIDGLIHISELSWGHVNHPSEVLTIGQEVSVKVLDIDRDRQRVSLGLKQTQEDPWKSLVGMHQVGDIIKGSVTKLVSFGAFVQIQEGIEGLVHISELANHHVEKPEEVVSVGDEIEVKIIEIDGDRRRLSLSIKRLQEPEGEEEEAGEEGAAEEAVEAATSDEATVEAAEEAAEESFAEAANLGLSDEVFTDIPGAAEVEAETDEEVDDKDTGFGTDATGLTEIADEPAIEEAEAAEEVEEAEEAEEVEEVEEAEAAEEVEEAEEAEEAEEVEEAEEAEEVEEEAEAAEEAGEEVEEAEAAEEAGEAGEEAEEAEEEAEAEDKEE